MTSNIRQHPISFASILNSNPPTPPPQSPLNYIKPEESPQKLSPPSVNLPPHFMSHSASVPPFTKQQQQQHQTMDHQFTPPSSSLSSPPLPPLKHSPPSKSKKILLSTSSPEGIQVASKITPTRLANLLIRKGPLPIRHITSQLALEVPSFDLLSLSKQRRLIMAAMEQTDLVNNVVFEKIGWGQWAVRKVDSDYIVTEGTEAGNYTHPTEDTDRKMINVNDLRNQTNLKLGWSKKKKKKQSTKPDPRRESITNHTRNLHDLKIPTEPLDSNAIESDSEDEYALSDHIDEDLSSEEEEEEEEEEDEDVFTFEDESTTTTNKFKPSPPIKFAKRVPIKFSPPPDGTSSSSRRKSSSSQPSTSAAISKPTYRHQIFPRSRLSSLENLDNYIVSSAKNSTVSINSPPTAAAPIPAISFSYSGSNSVLSASPANSWTSGGPSPSGNYIHHQSMDTISPERGNGSTATNRRKSSFNESHVRSTLINQKPAQHSAVPSSKLAHDEANANMRRMLKGKMKLMKKTRASLLLWFILCRYKNQVFYFFFFLILLLILVL
ncbi:uncharacterized protein SPAPADRAFT_60188 [Spathaspora passalidarum NRRL Y-27907]|uniref:Stb3p n=1 Tax=Spathaspora passalidarum (strain NRRL Y-27907 / 11-Y1) TaxID=619300 RepID=G3AK35_SPAPN|nr:uncharacterized protein SPAPADRAFT_60188 [Spathaspora passalidarum NRRL Y-27907]EGW32846.1 hypothetical protein SPAPADRAFT_60188 [Spathaspora passalidarum NRRL Y-27907]